MYEVLSNRHKYLAALHALKEISLEERIELIEIDFILSAAEKHIFEHKLEICTPRQHKKALVRAEHLMNAEEDSAEEAELDYLSFQIERYENETK